TAANERSIRGRAPKAGKTPGRNRFSETLDRKCAAFRAVEAVGQGAPHGIRDQDLTRPGRVGETRGE
ncbi:hypothetical protein SB861_70375, partial [Paraburkholderia sp. SIMBA_049]